MARIRTIKPEYWTDEVIVQLPFQARLLFIGLWNFADDHGAIEESPDRLRMQIFPSDTGLDIAELLDLLVAANLLERFSDEDGKRVIQVRNWHKHQKVDNPAKSRVLGEQYRKLSIPSEARRAVAVKYGCSPGATKEVGCYFCGLPGKIRWWKLADGRPSAWVVFDLELDHLDPESIGGANSAENLVLSCRPCNRGRRDKLALPWILSRTLASPIEDSDTSRGSLLGKDQGKGKGSRKGKRESEGDAEPPAGLDAAIWNRWLTYRQQIKKPIKSASMQAAQKALAAYGTDQAAVVEQSIAQGWQGLFPLKRNGNGVHPADEVPTRTWRPDPKDDEEPTDASR
jgi:HNH endonuclease